MSYADKVFKETCKDILENGTDTRGQKVRPLWEDGTPAYTIKRFGVVNRYDLRKEFPALTLRRIALKSCMDEILWIYQKKSNYIEDLKSHIWDSWSEPVTNHDQVVYVDVKSYKDFRYSYTDDSNKKEVYPHRVEDEKESTKSGRYYIYKILNAKRCLVQFIDTGSIKEVSRDHANHGTISDDFKRNTYGVGYLGNYKSEDIKEYFGEYFKRWVQIWRTMIYRCTSKDWKQYEKASVAQDFQCCETFLRWVMNNNSCGKSALGELELNKDYYEAGYYSGDTCTLLLRQENAYLSLSSWYYYDNKYFFSKNDLAKYLKHKGYNFIITEIDGNVKSLNKSGINNFIKNNGIKLINPHEVVNGKVIRFSLNRKHSIGTAYGYVVGNKFKFKDEMIDQTDYIRKQLKETPYSRRIMSNLYQFHYLSTGRLDPCCFNFILNVTEENNQLVLNGILNQRSQDMLAANGWNVCQYSIFLMMLAQEAGMVAGELVHVIADAHIYDRHVPMIKELLSRDEYPAPKVYLNPEVKNFYDFTTKDLIVEGYEYGEQIQNIPIAV